MEPWSQICLSLNRCVRFVHHQPTPSPQLPLPSLPPQSVHAPLEYLGSRIGQQEPGRASVQSWILYVKLYALYCLDAGESRQTRWCSWWRERKRTHQTRNPGSEEGE